MKEYKLLRVRGFSIDSYQIKQGKKEGDPGHIEIKLSVPKDEIHIDGGPSYLSVGEVLSAMNGHQETTTDVGLMLNFKLDKEDVASDSEEN